MKSADISIETGEGEVHRVKMMAVESFVDKKDPSERVENKGYKAIQTMEDEYVSLKAISEGQHPEGTQATVVRANGSYELNIYKNQAGELVENPQINARFVNRVDNPNPEEFGATFTIHGFLLATGRKEEDYQGEETGYSIFKVAPIDFRGMAHPIEFKAKGDTGDFFSEDGEANMSVVVQGQIHNKFIYREVEVDDGTAIGSAKLVKTERETDRKIEVIAGNLYEDEEHPNFISLEAIKKALELYEQHKVDKKSEVKKEVKKEATKSGGMTRVTSKTKSKSPFNGGIDVSDDDLPF